MTHYLHLLGHASPWLPATLASAAIVTLAFTLYRAARALRGKKAADALTVLAAAMASSVAATGMWHFFSRTMHLPEWIQAVLFAFMEIAVLASALRARANVARDGQAGADGLAVWVLTSASGMMSATEAASPQEALVRLGAPLVAAWLWERSMVPERRAQRAAKGQSADSAFAKIKRSARERFLAKVGVTDPYQSALEISQDSALDEVVRLTICLATFEGKVLAKRRQRKLALRRNKAFLASGAAGNKERKQMITQKVADILHGSLESMNLPSTWAVHVDALTRAAAPADTEPEDPRDRPVTGRDLPAVVATALMLARRDAEAQDEPDPGERPITAGELPGLFATAYVLAGFHAGSGPTSAYPDTGDGDTPGTRHPDTARLRHGEPTRATTPRVANSDTPDTDTRVPAPRHATPTAVTTRPAPARVSTLPVHNITDDVSHLETVIDTAGLRAMSKADAIRAIDKALPERTASQVVNLLARYGVAADPVLVRKTRSRDRQNATPGTSGDDTADTERAS
jgi:hypothetical protein